MVTDEQKTKRVSHLRWENMPGIVTKEVLAYHAAGPMTAREFMQHLGTDVMREMHEPVHVDHTINRILSEQSNLAIIPDVRFPNEVKAIQNAGGKVVRLTRNTLKDDHASECGLDPENFDWSNFDVVIHNDGSLEDTLTKSE